MTMDPASLSRRKFMKLTGVSGSALCLGIFLPAATRIPEIISGLPADPANIELNAWIFIDTAGKVTLVSHRAEMGQGAYHSLAQILAEELEVNLHEVNIIFAQGSQKKYGSQITGGSSTIRGSYKKLLQLSASARTVLIQAAATRWSVPVTECYAEGGHVIHRPTGRKFHYGELVTEASKLPPPKDVPLKKPSEYRLIRQPLERLDTPLKTNGAAVFGLDKKLPGMLYAVVERCPTLRGTVKSFDDSAALKMPGVKKVFKVKMTVFNTTREGVAVVATSTWAAMQARKALQVQWDETGYEKVNMNDIWQRQEEGVKSGKGLVASTKGDPDGMIGKADRIIEAVYRTPYEAHAAMEPLNCVAHHLGDSIEIWGPIQAPDWVQSAISKDFSLPPEKVTVNMTFLGGGFGRKAFLDYPQEAVTISREMNAPVQVVWTREDDMTQGPFRAGITYRGQAAISGGTVQAIKFYMSGQNIGHWSGAPKTKPNDSIAEGFLQPYSESIRNISFTDIPFEIPIPNMWWRSVYASTNGFAYESFMDELALACGSDPLEFRKQLLGHDPRCAALIEKLAAVSGWKEKQRHAGFGVAITECFSSTVGQVVKVSRNEKGKVQIDHVWAVMDCGWFVNPDIIRAQVEGSIIMALGAAAFHEISFRDGQAEQKNFYAYPMPRIPDIPPIEVFIMENSADAGGVGEPGLPPFAPAFVNAIFDLTGKRVRTLPVNMAEL
jgi:isoquinoline 1-oxidoreductase beta subunit